MPSASIGLNAAQAAEIRRLLTLPDGVLSDTRRRRLLVIQALSKGVAPEEICRRYKMSQEAVRQNKKRLEQIGVDAILRQLAKATDKIAVTQAATPQPVGRPKTQSFRAALKRKSLRDEPIVAWASLIIAADVQVAAFAVRKVPRAKDAAEPEEATAHSTDFFRSVRNAFVAPEKTQWTRGGVDEWLRRPLLHLHPLPKGPLPRARNSHAPTVTGRFSRGWEFIVLEAGEKKAVAELLRRLMGREKFKRVPCNSEHFLDHLERALYTLRVNHNVRGLLPFTGGLALRMHQWWSPKSQVPFEWHTTERKNEIGLKDRIVDFYVRASFGVLFDLTPNLLRKIPLHDRVRIGAFRLEPKVELNTERDRLGNVVGFYEPLPHIKMPIGFKHRGSVRSLEKRIRKSLASRPETAAFDYVVRPKKGQRQRMNFPHLEPSKGNPVANIEDTIAVVLLPRHFLMAPPTVSLKALAVFAEDTDKKDHDSEQHGVSEPFLVCHMPELLTAIDKAFRNNRYSASIEKLFFMEYWYRRLLSGPVTETVIMGVEHKEFGRLGATFPRFDYLRPGLSGEQNLRSREPARATTGAAPPSIPPASVPPDLTYFERITERPRYEPGYDAKAVLDSLYKSVDADFLLREIDERSWKNLAHIAQRWTEQAQEIISQIYFPKEGPTPVEPLLAVIPRRFKKLALRHEDSLPGYAHSIFQQFEPLPRVLRQVVENTQRFALAGMPLTPIAVYANEDLLRRWKSYLGKSLRDKLLRESRRFRVDDEQDEKPASADMALASQDDIRAITDVISKIVVATPGHDLVQRFVRLARECRLLEWAVVTMRFEEKSKLSGIAKRILKVVKLCRDAPNSRKIGAAVESLFPLR